MVEDIERETPKTRRRCLAFTRVRHRCKRDATRGSLFCTEHKRQPIAWIGRTLGGLGAIASIVALILVVDWPPKPKGHSSGPLFDIESGRLGYPVDGDLTIRAIGYECFESKSPQPLEIQRVPVVYDARQNNWRVRTNELIQDHPLSTFVEVPLTVTLEINGYSLDEPTSIHVLTDDLYSRQLEASEIASGRLRVNVGVSGFAGFLDLSDLSRPQFAHENERNLVGRGKGPIALLFVTSGVNELTRRSLPIGVVRTGLRFPEDKWYSTSEPNYISVDSSLPPLVVFQSRIGCIPRSQGIFAATIDGSEMWEISPAAGNSAIRAVDFGPPGRIYYESTYQTPGSMVCYMTQLERKPIPQPIRVDTRFCL